MRSTLAIVLSAAAIVRADDPPKPTEPARAPAAATPEYQLTWATYGPGADPNNVIHMLATGGKVYEIQADSKEVIVYDATAKVVRIFNLRLKRKAELGYAELDERLAALRKEALEEATRLEQQKGRADRVEGELKRSLIEPRYRVSFDESTHRLRLSNTCVEIDATGVHDDDPGRLAILGAALVNASKLRSVRNPQDLRNLTEVDVLSSLVVEHKLRPARVSFLFRLAGPPSKIRRIFEEPTAPVADLKRITQVEEMLAQARTMKLDDFDRILDASEIKD